MPSGEAHVSTQGVPSVLRKTLGGEGVTAIRRGGDEGRRNPVTAVVTPPARRATANGSGSTSCPARSSGPKPVLLVVGKSCPALVSYGRVEETSPCRPRCVWPPSLPLWWYMQKSPRYRQRRKVICRISRLCCSKG
uniref:Uncharacterized protein n=1 Tax=Oryza punctata TaxID=4537 RepID=A0A0E0KRC1_ORYPU